MVNKNKRIKEKEAFLPNLSPWRTINVVVTISVVYNKRWGFGVWGISLSF